MGLSDLFALFVCYTVVCDHWFFNPPITTPKETSMNCMDLFYSDITSEQTHDCRKKSVLIPLEETLTSNLPGFCGELLE